MKIAQSSWVRAWGLTAVFCLAMGLFWGLGAGPFSWVFALLAVGIVLLIKTPAKPVRLTGMTVTHLPPTVMLLIVIALAVLVTMLVTGRISDATVLDGGSVQHSGTGGGK